ncbi:hypothetical protein [Streptomyces cadmiisoli]|uniref:hypothetical protein n=1 Tax=Streptomyces cadmiisoli TaxID=2184053 RepID=UPI003D72DAAD
MIKDGIASGSECRLCRNDRAQAAAEAAHEHAQQPTGGRFSADAPAPDRPCLRPATREWLLAVTDRQGDP